MQPSSLGHEAPSSKCNRSGSDVSVSHVSLNVSGDGVPSRDTIMLPQSAVQQLVASPWFPHIILFVCQLCFAVMAITAHPALAYVPPLVFCTLRILFALPLLAVSARLQEPDFRPQWADVPWFAALGLAGVAVPQVTIFIGNALAGAAYTGVFTPTVSVFVALLSAALGIERISATKGSGIFLSVAGALVLVRVDKLDVHKSNTLGLLALLANCLSFAVYLVILQRYLARRPFPFSAFLCASVVGLAAIGACSTSHFAQVDWAAVPATAWAALLWAAFGASFIAHSGMAWAVGRCSAVVPSIYSCLQPLMTAGLAAAVLGQMLAPRDVGAMSVILGGVVLVIRAKLADDRARHEREAQYELACQDEEGEKGSAGGGGGRPLRRCPSKWHVPGLDSTGHILARTTGGSSVDLAALERAPQHGPPRSGPKSGSGAVTERGSPPASSLRGGNVLTDADTAASSPLGQMVGGGGGGGDDSGAETSAWQQLSKLTGRLLGRLPGDGGRLEKQDRAAAGAAAVFTLDDEDTGQEGLQLLPQRHEGRA